MSFRSYIAALLLAIATPLVAGLGYITYRDFEESRRDAERVVLRSAQLSAARIVSFLRESEDILRGLAQYPRLRALDPQQCGLLLKGVNDSLKYHANVLTRDAAGNLVCTAVPPKAGGLPRAPDPYYLKEVLRTGKFVIGKPVRSSIVGEWVVGMGYPLRDSGDGIVGVIALALDLAKFHEIASGVALIDGTATQIMTGDGIVIASSQGGGTAVGQDARHTDVVRKAPTASAGAVRAPDAERTDRIYGVATIPGTDWRVYAGTPAEAVFAKSRRGLRHNVLIITAIISLAALLSVFLARRVIRSVGNIAGAAAAVAAGNRTARAAPAGPLEMNLVAAQFNTMLDVLNNAEEAFRENYELLERIFATTHFCVVCLDRDLNFVRVNKAYADACGHPPEFFPGRNHFKLYPGEKVEVIFRRVVATGEPFTIYANPFEFPERPERGVTHWDWSLHPLKGESGDVEGLLFILLDVTERKRAERELQRKTELAKLLEQLARAANEAVSPEAAMEICLKRICEHGKWALGRVASFPTAEPRSDAEHSQWFCTEPARFDTFMRRSVDFKFDVDTGKFAGAVLREQRPVWLPDLTAIDKPEFGRLVMAVEVGLKAAFAFPVVVSGQVTAILEFFATETRPPDALLIAATDGLASQFARMIERKATDEAQARLAAIVEHSNDAILGRATDGTITSWNAAAERLLGYTAAEVIGRDPVEIFPPESQQKIGERRKLLRAGQLIPDYETVRFTKDGRRIDVAAGLSAIKDASGRIIGTASLLRDISERKRAEKALRSYAARLHELSRRLREVEESERRAISRELHDRIGQELTTLSLMVGVLDAKLTGESRNAVETLLKDMQALVQYVVAHVRDVMAELRPPVLDDYGLLASLRQLTAEFTNRTGIAVNISGVDPYPRLPLVVETAMFRISQEALNNIAKHAHAKKVKISLNPVPERVVLDIADDGVGFDTSKMPHGEEHWGIITMRERAEAIGIALRLESAPGAGTRVVLEVKREET